MKHLFASFLAVLLLHDPCAASLIVDIPVPYDDKPTKFTLWTNAATTKQILSDRKLYYALEGQLQTLTVDELTAIFGASKPAPPSDFALPVHRHSAVGFSGLGYRGDKRSYFLHIGEVGGVLVFPYGNGSFVSAVALYLKTDSEFVALRNLSDYPRRRAWEIQRTEALRKQIQASLPKRPVLSR